MGHPELFSRACDNINKTRVNNSDVPFYCIEYMFYHTSSMEGNYIAFCFDCAPPACFYQT